MAKEPVTKPPRCPHCDAAINVEQVGDTNLFVSDCCGKPFRWPPKFDAPVIGK